MDLPDLAKPRSVGPSRGPNFVSSPDDGYNPGEGDEDRNRKKTEQQKDSSLPCGCQNPCVDERSSKEEGFCESFPMTRVLNKLRVTLWEVSVDEDRNPNGNGEEGHCSLNILLLPKHSIEAMGAPEGSDCIACKVNVDRGTYDGEEDDGVEPGQLSFEKRNPAGD